MRSVRVTLSSGEMEQIRRLRALGFSSDGEILRVAALAWTDLAAKQKATERPDASPLPRVHHPTTSSAPCP